MAHVCVPIIKAPLFIWLFDELKFDLRMEINKLNHSKWNTCLNKKHICAL